MLAGPRKLLVDDRQANVDLCDITQCPSHLIWAVAHEVAAEIPGSTLHCDYWMMGERIWFTVDPGA